MLIGRSAFSILAVTSGITISTTSTSALSLHHPVRIAAQTTQQQSRCSTTTTTTILHLTPRDDLSDYGRNKQDSELDSLVSKRDQIRAAKLANIKPNDDEPKLEEMSDEEVQAMFAAKSSSNSNNNNKKSSAEGEESGDVAAATASSTLDIDDLFSNDYVPEFKTKRSGGGNRGLSGGDAGGILGELSNLDGGEDGDENAVDRGMFVDWTEDYNDENEFHIPNRIGVSTADWGVGKAGFVSGKLKKKERRGGKFNKTDLKKAYEKLQQNGISFVTSSESNPISEAFLQKFMAECDHGDNSDVGALIASTYPNPWKHAIKSRSLPRRGPKAIINAAESSCDRLGISSLTLYQVDNPWYYIGGSSALAEGMLDVIADDHSRYVGCINVGVTKLAKLQRKLRAQGEFVATNTFEFSLMKRGNMKLIETCKKLGITPVCTNVLDGGLATGKYTSTNPTGGEVSKGEGDTGPYPVRTLDKLDALFKVQNSLREKVNRRIGDRLMKIESGQAPKINRDITTTQIAINYVRAKGAVPLVQVNNVKMANELLGCLGWDLSEEEVMELDKACKASGV